MRPPDDDPAESEPSEPTPEENQPRSIRFVLPPINLPPVRIPPVVIDWLPFTIPGFRRFQGRVRGSPLLAAGVLDVFNAGFVLTGNGGVGRVVISTVLVVVLVGPVGVGYAWEVFPTLLGHHRVGVFPTATILVLLAGIVDRRR